MKQLANDYETGKWTPFGDTGGEDEGSDAVIAPKPPKSHQKADKPRAKKATTTKPSAKKGM